MPTHPQDHPQAPAGLSRRRFLGSAATALAAGAVGLAPLAPGGSAAEAAAGAIGPLTGNARLDAAVHFREAMIQRIVAKGMPEHHTNGDEYNLPGFIGNY